MLKTQEAIKNQRRKHATANEKARREVVLKTPADRGSWQSFFTLTYTLPFTHLCS